MLHSICNLHVLGEHAHVKEVVVFILKDPEEFQSLKANSPGWICKKHSQHITTLFVRRFSD